jgi:hypothetical protein
MTPQRVIASDTADSCTIARYGWSVVRAPAPAAVALP